MLVKGAIGVFPEEEYAYWMVNKLSDAAVPGIRINDRSLWENCSYEVAWMIRLSNLLKWVKSMCCIEEPDYLFASSFASTVR